MSLEQSCVLVDRALVTLCQELPESLGLYNTGKDQLSLGALRAVPLLESLAFDSKKHLILRDWMRAYEPKADQPLSSEISMDTLRQTLRDEKRQSVSYVRGMHDDLLASSSSASKAASSSSSDASVAATAHAHRKQERRERREAKRGRTYSASSSGKTRAKNGRKKSSKKGRENVGSGSGKAAAKRPRKRQEASDESEYESSSSSSTSASSTSSLSSDSGEREEKRASKSNSSTSKGGGGRAKAAAKSGSSNLPPVEVVLSSDEDDDEPNDLFDTEDPDVYEVESILDKRKGVRFGDPDLYLIKWVGYEAPTWEPAANVSKDLVEEFEGQPVRENEYVVEEIRDRKSSRDKDTKLKSFKYLIKWVGYDDLTWEPADNLPHNLRRKFDQRFEARKRRKTA